MNFNLRYAPLIRLAIPFFFGVLFCIENTVEIRRLLPFAGLLFLAYILVLKGNKIAFKTVSAVLVSALFFCLGMLRMELAKGDRLDEEERIYGLTVLRTFGKQDNFANTLCEVYWNNGKRAKAFVTFENKDSTRIVEGNRFVAKLAMTTIFKQVVKGGFDKAKWAKRVGATGQAFCAVQNRIAKESEPSILRQGLLHRNALMLRLKSYGISAANIAVAGALLLGDKSELSSTEKAAFQRSGTIHVLAVSGLHVGILFGIVSWLLVFLNKTRAGRWLRALLTIAVLWGYVFLTGGSPSVMRAAAMFSIVAFSLPIERVKSHLNSLALAALIILIVDPLMAFSLGFRLSFTAVLGILIFYKALNSLVTPNGSLARFIWSMACVSLAAQLATSPIVIYEFGFFPTWFLPANIVVVSLVSLVIVPIGAFVLAFGWIGSLGQWIGAVFFNPSLTLLRSASEFFADLPAAYIAVRIDAFQLLLLFIALAVFAYSFAIQKRLLILKGLSMLLILLVWYAQAAYSHHRSELVVHDTNTILISSLQGRSLSVVGVRNEYNKKALASYAHAMGAQISAWSSLDSLNGALQIDELTIIYGAQHIDTLKIAQASELILCSDLSRSKRRFLKSWARRRGVNLHDIRVEGAFVD